jgi:CMP-N,N'-diacetyllegionaminic acid synthase
MNNDEKNVTTSDNSRRPSVLVTICARGGSKGVPGKNARSIAGESLISRAINCAKASSLVVRIIISTDDEQLAAIANDAGGDAPFLRPAELASDDAPKVATIRHAAAWVKEHYDYHPDIVVDLDIGVPTRSPKDIESCVDRIWSDGFDTALTVYESERNPYFNMVEINENRAKLVVPPSDPSKGIVARQQAPDTYSASPSVFAWKADKLHITHLFEGNWGAVIVPRERAIDIDSELDFELASLLIAKQNH